MSRRNSGFTLLETLTSISIVALLLVLLIPQAGRVRNADGFQVSMANLATIMKATIQYHADNAGRSPLRACAYTNGQPHGGYDTYSVGGKNCSNYWAGQMFDEPAYFRFLNPYLYQARIPEPMLYVNTGSGSTWHFIHGTPTAQQRLGLEIPVFKSPGDIASIHQQGIIPNPAISSYDDVGTSYMTNMKWWGSMPGSTWATRYEEGVNRINLAFNGANPNFVFMHDQTAERVAVSFPPYSPIQGEFGKVNASMMGFADGRVSYMYVVPGYANTSGPGYTFLP